MLALSEFDQEFSSDESCLEWLKNQKYPHGIECPVCKKTTRHHKLSKRPCYSCDICGNQIYPTSGTIFHKSSTPLRTWFKVISRMSHVNENISAREIQREYGMTYKTAWRMVQKVKMFLKGGGSTFANESKSDDNIINNDSRSQATMGIRKNALIINAPAGKLDGQVSITPSRKRFAEDVPVSNNVAAVATGKRKEILADNSTNIFSYQDGNQKGNYSKRDRTARLLKLQILLWQNPQGLTIEEIARKCFTSKRTVYRDLRALESELGVPIWEDNNKRGLTEGYSLPPITFTLIEAFNIFIASRLLQKYSYLYIPSLASTFMKINTITPQPLKKQIQNSLDYLEKQPKDECKINNLNKLIQAWLSQHRVKVRYQDDIFGKDPLEIIIDPYFMEPVSTGRSIFVVAYTHLIKSIYSFKLDRIIGDVIVCSETYEIPSDFNAVDHIDSTWGRYADEELITVKLHFKQKISKVVKATTWHPSQKIDPQNDGSIIATYRIRNTIDFRSWVFGWGDEVEVLEPESFRNQIKEIIQSLAAIYSR